MQRLNARRKLPDTKLQINRFKIAIYQIYANKENTTTD